MNLFTISLHSCLRIYRFHWVTDGNESWISWKMWRDAVYFINLSYENRKLRRKFCLKLCCFASKIRLLWQKYNFRDENTMCIPKIPVFCIAFFIFPTQVYIFNKYKTSSINKSIVLYSEASKINLSQNVNHNIDVRVQLKRRNKNWRVYRIHAIFTDQYNTYKFEVVDDRKSERKILKDWMGHVWFR